MDGLSQIETELAKLFEWHLTAINSAIETAILIALWQDIAVRYNESQRAYHSLRHVQQLFAQFKQIKHHLNEPHIIALALFYHDVIYKPTCLDNELKSAEYAVESLTPYLTAEQCQHIYALIMMTASHQIADIDEWSYKARKSDAAYLLDMDLSILGASWSEYEQYAQAIRQEYAHISNEDYRVGRIAVLKGLLAHPTLYLTDYYSTRLEMPARRNIKREITSLAS
ncbi:putative metal-dependent HD superfamily phosphohydrolase [Psychrobacter luti]|uniref:Putative metal-dependent HD superfamily phosphohydrolase n=1 Tax=Psychrobacter luti TaxID=198481 RepID=A0A839TG64_9GAMM|nr:hypothetical protein [Psychrobacter luti]MBB3106994.1 putative metal-dependent HD superfamily phosphohydrolase [Psychrobacter luti]